MSQPTVTLDSAIAAFATAVRSHLDDLSADDVDDLTGGLEADLIEEASDLDGQLDLDDPAAYAEELRASAGLPPRGASRAPLGRRLAGAFDSLEAATQRVARSTRLGAWLLDFAISLRAVWWVFRGWAAYELTQALAGGGSGPVPSVPSGLIQWALLALAVVVSVQWGRGKWVPGSFLRAVRVAVSIVTIVAAPFLGVWALNNAATSSPSHLVHPDSTGLWLDGRRISNVFGYDADGNPISNLQLFDQDGEPIVTVGAANVRDEYGFLVPRSAGDAFTVPRQGGAAGTGWNVYPLENAPISNTGQVEPAEAEPATPPFRTIYPVPGASASAEPNATPPTATAPSATPQAAPGQDATK